MMSSLTGLQSTPTHDELTLYDSFDFLENFPRSTDNPIDSGYCMLLQICCYVKSKSNMLFKNDGSLHVGSMYADRGPGENISGPMAPGAGTGSSHSAFWVGARLLAGLFFIVAGWLPFLLLLPPPGAWKHRGPMYVVKASAAARRTW